jgi:uncharacterized protein YbjT (DUF2867 family)
MKKILIAGANGFVGTHLIESLIADDSCAIHALVRSESKGSHFPAPVKLVVGDLLAETSLPAGAPGANGVGEYDVAYYLVHGLKGDAPDFEYQEAKAAANFTAWMRAVGCKKIVYLGALGPESDESPHLRSRHLVGKVLTLAGIPCLELRASIVIGAGSTSFEMIKALSERLPFSPDFKRIENLCQPIALSDLLLYLKAALSWDGGQSRVVEIGGQDRISYSGLMKLYLKTTHKNKKSFKVPPVDDRVFKKLMDLVIPEMADVGKKLYDSLIHETIVTDRSALDLFPQIEPIACAVAMTKAVDESKTIYPHLWGKEMVMFLLKEKVVQPHEVATWLMDQNLVKTFMRLKGHS